MPAVLALVVLTVGSLLLRPSPTDRSDVVAWILSGTFLATYLAGPVIGVDVPLLSRHWIQIVPFLLYAAWRLLQRYGSPVQLGLAVALLVWSLGSANGRWHPSPDLNNEVFQERTTAVYDMIDLRSDTIAVASEQGLPTFTSLNTWFRSQYPAAGFTSSAPDWTPVTHGDSVDPQNPATLPDRFIVILDAPDRSGNDDVAFAAAVEATGAFDVESTSMAVGRYAGEVRVYTRS